MPDYKQGKIYTIRCKTNDTLIYVGCTTEALSTDWNDWYIEFYENYPCENKEQLNKREGEIIREIGTVNKTIAGRTLDEYYQTNIDKLLEKMKVYRQNNKEKKRNTYVCMYMYIYIYA